MERILVESNLDHRDAKVESVMNKAKMATAQAVSDISADIEKMMNKREYSDVAFNCKDGVPVYASRLFLTARSAVFRGMFSNGMVESQRSEIALQEISSTGLLAVMEFLYAGNLQKHRPKSWKNAYEILGAAKFFLLEGLELIALDYLLRGVGQVGADIEAVAKLLSITVEFVGAYGETVEPVALELVCILESRSLKLEHLRALTENAFMYLLQKTKVENGEAQEEFLRLKNVVLWCACKKFASVKKNLALHFVPAEFQSTQKLLEKPPVQLELTACEQSEIATIRKALAVAVKKYLPLVNLRQIPLQLLVHVVKPMGIIPSSAMADALQFHAVGRPYKIERGRAGWLTSFKDHKIYRMDKGGTRIQRIAAGVGFARFNFPMNCEEGDVLYVWKVIIEKVCDGFIEIGLHHDLGGNFSPEDGQSLSGQPGGWALRMDAQGLFINRPRRALPNTNEVPVDSNLVLFGQNSSQRAYGKHYGHEYSVIKVTLHLFEGVCLFTVDNKKEKLVWSGLPKGTFFPAVSLGSGSNGAVQIKILGRDEWDDDDDDDDDVDNWDDEDDEDDSEDDEDDDDDDEEDDEDQNEDEDEDEDEVDYLLGHQ